MNANKPAGVYGDRKIFGIMPLASEVYTQFT